MGTLALLLAVGLAATPALPPEGLDAVAPLAAATALERFLYDRPRDPRAPAAARRLARAYLAAGRPAAGTLALLAAEAHAPPAERPALRLARGDTMAAVGEETAAIARLAAPYLAEPATAPAAYGLLLRTHVARAEWPQALALLDRWAAARPADAPGLAPIQAAIRAHMARPRPAAWLVVGLGAVVPGAGRLYLGEPGPALASLAANGATFGLLAGAVRAGDPVGVLLVAPWAARYYVGGLMAADASLARAERQADAALAARLRADHADRLLPP